MYKRQVVHFFSTPYLMMRNSLSKLNSSWETTASMMGDTWIKTIVRIVTPNMTSTILEVFSYYFVNAMVTVSAVIFIAGARTMVITTKIKELQYYTKFNEVFVLSLFILGTNLLVKGILGYMIKRKEKKDVYKRQGGTEKQIDCVQTGAYAVKANAEAMRDKLVKAGFEAVIVKK